MAVWNDRAEAWHEVLPGVRRRILARGDGVTMVLYRVDPNVTFPRHTHPHVQAGACLEGGGRLTIGPDTVVVRKGSAYSIPGGLPHEFVSGAEGPSVILDVFVPDREDLVGEALPADETPDAHP